MVGGGSVDMDDDGMEGGGGVGGCEATSEPVTETSPLPFFLSYICMYLAYIYPCLKGQSHEIFRVFLQQSSIDQNQERGR